MSVNVAVDPMLARFHQSQEKMYGDRLERLVLFGSRAHGDARPDSDYDVALFLRGFHDRWAEMDRILPVVTEILYDQGVLVHAMPYRAGDRQRPTRAAHTQFARLEWDEPCIGEAQRRNELISMIGSIKGLTGLCR